MDADEPVTAEKPARSHDAVWARNNTMQERCLHGDMPPYRKIVGKMEGGALRGALFCVLLGSIQALNVQHLLNDIGSNLDGASGMCNGTTLAATLQNNCSHVFTLPLCKLPLVVVL